MKKIQVPPAMLEAVVTKMLARWEDANDAYRSSSAGVDAEKQLRKHMPIALEAALRWFSDNPIVPTGNQVDELRRACDLRSFALVGFERICTEWQRRMFLAPEPEVPEDLKQSELWCNCSDNSTLGTLCRHNRPLVGAYLLGKASKC